MSKIIDISVPIDLNLPLWPGTPEPRIVNRKSFLNGDGVMVSDLTIGLHTGTHIDAPSHHIRCGKNVDDLPLDVFYGMCIVVDMSDVRDINASVLENRIPDFSIKRVLFKTDNSKLYASGRFSAEYTALTKDGADWLVKNNYVLIGIDYLSIQRPGEPADTHVVLLENDVSILEGVCLLDVPSGKYTIACQPLRVKDAEASPVRAILIEGAS